MFGDITSHNFDVNGETERRISANLLLLHIFVESFAVISCDGTKWCSFHIHSDITFFLLWFCKIRKCIVHATIALERIASHLSHCLPLNTVDQFEFKVETKNMNSSKWRPLFRFISRCKHSKRWTIRIVLPTQFVETAETRRVSHWICRRKINCFLIIFFTLERRARTPSCVKQKKSTSIYFHLLQFESSSCEPNTMGISSEWAKKRWSIKMAIEFSHVKWTFYRRDQFNLPIFCLFKRIRILMPGVTGVNNKRENFDNKFDKSESHHRHLL